MKKGFLTKTIGGRRIEHIPCPHPGVQVNLSTPAIGVMHTIEGSLGLGLSVFQRHFAPHFALDGKRIVQMAHRPELPYGGKGQDPMPPWAWKRASALSAAHRGPH